MDKYLITGSTGFVGATLINYLQINNSALRILSRSPVQGYENWICDFEKEEIPCDALESIDIVVHLAGIAHDVEKRKFTENIYNIVNVKATIDLAKKAARAGVKKFIFISSVKAGGRALQNIRMDETHQNSVDNIYGATKRKAEMMLLEIGLESKMHISIIRPSLIYGPNMKGNLSKMMNGIKSGWFPPLPNNGNQRSMVHVDDVIRAILFVSKEKKANGQIFILTDGKSYSSREIYETMCKELNVKIPKWAIPYFVFKLISLLSKNLAFKVDKLFGDEYYSSSKLSLLGFEPSKTFKEMNETYF